MPGSRTIITLSALLASMTVGSFILLALEAPPPNSSAGLPLAARQPNSPFQQLVARQVSQTNIPLRRGKWKNVIVHDGSCDMADQPRDACHFIIHSAGPQRPDGGIEATGRWRQQADGSHVRVPGHDLNATSIGIYLAGNPSAAADTDRRMNRLLALVRILQRQLDIPADHIHLHSDLTGQPCPGDGFSAGRFRRLLLSHRR